MLCNLKNMQRFQNAFHREINTNAKKHTKSPISLIIKAQVKSSYTKVPALCPLTRSAAPSKFLGLSEPQFPHLGRGNINNLYSYDYCKD